MKKQIKRKPQTVRLGEREELEVKVYFGRDGDISFLAAFQYCEELCEWIDVTGYFRKNPDAFGRLEEKVLPLLDDFSFRDVMAEAKEARLC